jgi:hypothetical protein
LACGITTRDWKLKLVATANLVRESSEPLY